MEAKAINVTGVMTAAPVKLAIPDFKRTVANFCISSLMY